MEPYNYASQLGLGGVIPSFADSMGKGFQLGAAIQDQRMQQEANALKIKQAEAAAAQQAEQQRQLQEFSNNPNPTAKDYARIMTAMPQLSEGFKRSWDILEPAQKDEHWKQTASVYAATLNGKPEVAAQLLNDRADALENSGDTAKAESVRRMADLTASDPEYAKKMAFMSMYAQDPKKATDLATELDRQTAAPVELAGKVADTQTKQVAAKYAESKAVSDLEQAGWNIKAIQADIGYKKESNRIAAINAAANRESNGLKRQELQLKLNDALSARDTRIRENAAAAESGAASIDNMTNTINRVLSSPGLDKVVGSVQGRLGSYLSDEGSDAIALIDTLGSQAFLSQIAAVKGMGSLSNAEGEKLQAAFQNFSRTQSETQFRSNLKEGLRLLTKARKNTEQKFGVPLSAPDTPAAARNQPGKAAPAAEQKNITVDF